jgi:23S rRNA (cytosine1962-C5)-methyltransferase
MPCRRCSSRPGSCGATIRRAREPEGLERYVEVADGEVPDEVRVNEDGIEFGAPIRTGQKTGWFYDQRDNRARLARYRPSQRARRVFLHRRLGLVRGRARCPRHAVDSSARRWTSPNAGRSRLNSRSR